MALRLAIAGAGGRMGQAVVEAALGSSDMEIASALDIPDSAFVGHDAGERFGRTTGAAVQADVDAALRAADVLIDFTRPVGSIAHVAACVRHRVGAVIGTTGLDAAQQRQLAEHARTIPIVYAPNMSVGVNVLLELVESAARALGSAYDIEILEIHHKHKVDAPSGTAIQLGKAASAGRALDFASSALYSREGEVGPRKPDAIGFATLRGGDVVGEHTVMFVGPGERIEITHRATSRQNFAAGALRAARFVAAKRSAGAGGLFDMRDVLGLNG
ncbi:MAG TPA: 4-hydroxy-tetrahydrodipicolinate reductase [Casimicrobiaceae bacterium]|jgi:4-hydroxy-tetrahydrodipicolinate reductase